MEAPRCTRCGQVQAVDSQFCFRCGNRNFEGTPPEEPRPARSGPIEWRSDPDPVAEEAEPEPRARATGSDVIEVSVPDWLLQDWAAPAALAVCATLFGLIANYLLELFVVVASIIGSSPTFWGDIAGQPLVIWAGFHGAMQGFSLSVTGLAWIVFAAVMGLRFARALLPAVFPAGSADRATIVPRAIKTGIVTSGVMVVLSLIAAAVIEPIEGSMFAIEGRAFFGSANIVGAVFVGFFMSAIAAGVALARDAGLSPSAAFGVQAQNPPSWLAPAWTGAKRVLMIGVLGSAVFFYFAQLIDLASPDFGPGGRDVVALAFAFIPWLLAWSALDIGGITLLNEMRFFVSEPGIVLSGKPAWTYLSVLIAAGAFSAGGAAAARAARPADGTSALRAAVLPAAIVGPVLVVGSLFWVDPAGGEIVGSALLLPLLWIVVLAAGGFFWATRAGIASGVTVRPASGGPTSQPPVPSSAPPSPADAPVFAAAAPPSEAARARFCSQCGNGLDEAARFCSRCGSPVTGG